MSISIRSNSQRQLARRGPAVAPSHSCSTTSPPSLDGAEQAAVTTASSASPALHSVQPADVAPREAEAAAAASSSRASPVSRPTTTPPLSASGSSSGSDDLSQSSRSVGSTGGGPPPTTTTPLSSASTESHHMRSVSARLQGFAASGAAGSPTAPGTTPTRGGGGGGGSSSSNAPSLLYSVSRFTEPVKRIVLIRNGRSEANEDVGAYVHTPDWRIPLVEEGKREAIAAGRALSELIGDEPVYFYYSPYIRSRQSLRYVLQGIDEARLSGQSHAREWWEEEEGTGVASPNATLAEASAATSSSSSTRATPNPLVPDAQRRLHRDPSLVLNSGTSNNIIGVREDVRLRDGDIGRYTSTDELMHHLVERERYGKFFYRFPFGESGADVCDRVTSFLDAFQRERVEFPMDTNVVIITHGLTMRMFIKRWFHLTVETFHKMRSPPSGSLCTLTRLHHRSCFRLDDSCVESMHLPLSLNEFNGYKYRNKQLLGSMSSGAPYM
ncbi:phosphoglycerate mutase [Novymonas esmeraldas]|uniref:Phosphoglycerate mutase n=1 Tax=Novymonas esmeraldas TaxID=1808958 RepID=A0AAW0F5T4_9TRYP